MSVYKIRLSGILAELNIRSINSTNYNRNGGRKKKLVTTDKDLSDEELKHQQNVQEHSISNTLRTFKRLVYANFSDGFTFLTLTFNEESRSKFDTSNSTICRQKFSNFWKNLKRGTKPKEKIDDNVDMRYIAVEEFHGDGTIHYHVLCHIPKKYESLLKKNGIMAIQT